MSATDGTEDPLLGELRLLLPDVDPVPDDVVEQALGAIAWATVDRDLAELAADSAVEVSGVRGDGSPRLLTFAGHAGTVEVEVSRIGDRLRLLGFLSPVAPGEVTVRHRGGELPVRADAGGRFRATGVHPGPVSLIVAPEGRGSRIVTEWVSL